MHQYNNLLLKLSFCPLSSSCLLWSCSLTNWVLTIIWRYVFHRWPVSLVRTNCNAVIVDGLNCHAKWEDLCSINTYMSWLCIQIRIRMISNGTLATSRCPVRYRKHSTTCIHMLASTRTAQPASTWAVQPGSTRTVQPDGGSSFVMISVRAVFPWWRPAHQEAAWSGYTTKSYLVWQRFAAEHDEEAP